MISWMQQVLQRHYKWLFTIMLAVIIVAFVFTIGASPGISAKEKRVGKAYFGYDLNSQSQLQELFRSANISNLFDTGQNLTDTRLAERMALQRPAMLDLADKLQIAEPTEFELAEFIKEKSIFKSPSGRFDQMKYENFLELIETDPQLTQERVKDTLTDDYRIDQVLKSLEGPGFVLPFEAELSLERQNTTWAFDVAVLDFSNLNTPLNISNDELQHYYKQKKYKYKIPDQLRISYALFPSSRFESSVQEPSTEDLRDFYDSNMGMFMKKESEVKPFEEIQPKVKQEYRKYMSRRKAAEVANEFAYTIYENEIKKGSQEFLQLLHNNNLTLVDIPPFNKGTVPEGTRLPRNILAEASNLTEERYYSDTVESEDGVVIVFLNETIPSRFPELEAIKRELEREIKDDQNLKLLDSRSKVLAKTLKKAGQEGEFARKARSEGLSVKSYSNIKLSEPPKELSTVLLQDVLMLGEGEVSAPVSADDKVTFVHVKTRKSSDVNTHDDSFKNVLGSLRMLTATASSQSVVQELINDALDLIPQEQ